jgi:S1-C subfamily serine protease
LKEFSGNGCGSDEGVQNFKTDVAWIVLEWNGQPQDYGSGFLVDKDRGEFYTNKH